MCLETWGGSSLAPYFEGILNTCSKSLPSKQQLVYHDVDDRFVKEFVDFVYISTYSKKLVSYQFGTKVLVKLPKDL